MKTFFLFLSLILIPFATYPKEFTTVQSDCAQYDGKDITLNGSVIVENTLGKIEAQNAKLMRGDGKSKIDFPQLELKQNVQATLYNGSKLHCAYVHLDYDTLKGIFTGNEGDQVHYLDQLGEIFADQAQITYAYVDGEYKPVKILLVNNVKLINHSSNEKNADTNTLQYALADSVEFFPDNEVMVLQANQGKKVLFFDTAKDLQLSARTVKGSRDSTSGTQSIQGVGDVRFTFGQDELEKIKKHFKIE